MRSLAIVILVIAGRASADSFVVIDAGLAAPIGDKDWDNAVDPSFKLGVRAGGGRPDLAGYASFDFTPLSTGGSTSFSDFSFQRYRVLGGVQLMKPVVSNIVLLGRLGLGVDIAHASYTANLPIIGMVNASDSSVGFAFEPGGGLWFDLGSAQVGFEVALAIGYHDSKASQQGEFNFQYTSYDIDLLGGVRLGL